MAIGKRSAKGNMLLWTGLAMIVAAFLLMLVGFLYGSQAGNYSAAPSGIPRSLSEARETFEGAVNSLGNPNLGVEDVMEFANNYYAEVKESDTGVYAMELLVDKRTGRVYREPGPNMMWNTKYSMMSGRGMGGMLDSNGNMMGPGSGGMMGSPSGGMMGNPSEPSWVSPEDQMPISPEGATRIAGDYLSRTSPSMETEEPDQFYGYYTLHTKSDGEVTGMLSVNGYTGAVWYHNWHGPFIAMEEESNEG